MKSKTKLALSLSCAPIVLTGLSPAATLVKINTAFNTGVTSSQVYVSTGSVRAGGTAPPANSQVQGSMSPEVSSAPGGNQAAEGPTSGRPSTQSEGSGQSSRSTKHQQKGSASAAPVTSTGAPYSAKGGVPAPITYNDPGAFGFSVDGGYSSKHLYRGIDLAQFTSFNYLNANMPEADSDILFFGATATYKGFALGMKYIETIDDTFNPYNALLGTTFDSYSELVISANYTRMLVGDDLLQGTFGFDFYYYPNDLFWGVSNQGMFYANFICPRYKWAQPFLNLFYNVAIDTSGSGFADPSYIGNPLYRGASGSDLVEGMGAEVGLSGGDQIWSNDFMSVAATYSLSTIYKSGYAFEEDGFSHVSLTVGLPVTIGKNITITPSVSYVEALSDIPDVQGIVGSGALASAWNEPGWVAAVRVNWQF